MFSRMRSWVVFGMALLGVLAVVGEAQAKHLGLAKQALAKIAWRGFFEVINSVGAWVLDPLNLASPDDFIPYQRNSYTWSSAWFNGSYYVGTVRNVLCYLSPDDPPDPLCVDSPGLNDFGEIWRYTPRPSTLASPNPGGIEGTWTRVLQSPCIVQGGGFLLPACGGSTQFGVPANLPRDIGYRGMTVSQVGDLPLDSTARLWVAAFGLGGRILHSTNGTAFTVASINGLATIAPITNILGLNSLNSIPTVDLGYRSILIWKGRICIAPVGSQADVDLAFNPTVLCNSNPASTSSTWQTIVNVQTHLTLGDPDNLGVFQMAVFNGDLYIGVTNRTTGVQVWKLPSSVCPTPISSSTTCTANSPLWQRIITQGGGRLLDSDGLPSSAGVSDMKVYNGGSGDALYVATSESAAFNFSAAELFRVNQTGPGQPITWNLIMGRPRVKSVMDLMNVDPALAADFNCLTTVNVDRTQFNFGGTTGTVNACFPLSDMSAGFGAGFSGGAVPVTGGFGSGNQGYIWRMAVHNDGSGTGLYGGTLDLNNGFDLMKSMDGVNWKTAGIANAIVNNGLDNENNYGVRTLFSVLNWPGGAADGVSPGPALLVGTANPFTDDGPPPALTGGAEVHVGTCAPLSVPTAVASVITQARRAASAGPPAVTYLNQVIGPVQLDSALRYVAFDDDSVHNSSVDVSLVGSASYDTFCGDLISYQWYDTVGNFIAPLSPALPGNPIPGGGGSTTIIGPKLTIPNLPVTLPTSGDYIDYTFRLCVTDGSSLPNQPDCEDVNVRASYNLPPTAAITAVPAPISGGACGNTSRVSLVDVDGSTDEMFTAQGTCSDPENPGAFPSASPASCVWSADSGVTFAGLATSTGGPDGDPNALGTSYNVTAPVGDGNIFLTATDDHGYISPAARTRVRVIAPVHDVNVTAIAPPAVVPAPVGAGQNVTVTVRNDGHFTETFSVTLVDATGGTVGPPQTVTNLSGCVSTLGANTHPRLCTCPSAPPLTFLWTPTTPAGQPHTLTATVTTVITGETNTGNNSRSVPVAMVNQAPSAIAQSPATNEDTPVGIILTGSDPDADPLTFLVGTGPTRGTLSGTPPNLTYTPTLNLNGPDSFTFTVSDGSITSAPATVSITVNPVNDAPSFTKGGNLTVSAVAGLQTVVNWATNRSAGPSDESGQTLNFIVSNNNNGLFTGQPVISPAGTLTYTPAAGANGVATVTVQLHDNGLTANSGVDTSAPQTFTITVNGVSSFAPPTGVIATLTATPRQVHLVWTDNATTETRYEVQRCRITFGLCRYSTVVSSLAANTISYNNTVSSAGTYRFQVRACNTSCTPYGVSNNIPVP